jgi:hypothetical protein
VNREVELAPQERLVELAGEDIAPVYDGERGLGVVVTGGPYDAYLDRETRRPQPFGARLGLRQGELRASGAEDY